MKNNIVFTFNDKTPMFALDDEEFDYYQEDTETEEESADDINEEEDEEDEEEEEEEEEEEIKKKNKKEDLSEKLADDISEEEWMELARKQEKELREKGLYYSTKYDKNDIILLKQKGWKNFKKGKVVKVNRHKIRKKVTYNIKLDKKFKGKQLYKNVLSNRIKVYEKNEDIMEELETLIKLKNDKGSEAMKKKFNDLCKAKEKKERKS